MIALKVLFLVAIGYGYTNGQLLDPDLQIVASNVPNIQYELDALDTLTEAFRLHPDTVNTVSKSWSELFTLKHSGNWSVGAGCQYLYTPSILTYVEIQDKNNQIIFWIFGTK